MISHLLSITKDSDCLVNPYKQMKVKKLEEEIDIVENFIKRNRKNEIR